MQTTATDPRDIKRRMAQLLDQVTTYYEDLLWTSPDAAPAREMLQKRRIVEGTARAFRLGFAPPGWETTHRYFSRQGIPVTALEELGLAIRRKTGRGSFDKFRSRLIFPLMNGPTVVSLTGRAVLPGDTGPKYTRTKSTLLSDSTPALFGLDQGAPQVPRTGRVLVVEGFFDAMTLHQHELRSSVALSGTNLSDAEIALLGRFGARDLHFLFDGDAGGHAAARLLAVRLRHAALPSRFAFCPDGQDPDQVVHHLGPQALVQLAGEGRSPADLIIDAVTVSQRDSVEARVHVLRELLAKLIHRSRPLSDAQFERMSSLFGISASTIRSAAAAVFAAPRGMSALPATLS